MSSSLFPPKEDEVEKIRLWVHSWHLLHSLGPKHYLICTLLLPPSCCQHAPLSFKPERDRRFHLGHSYCCPLPWPSKHRAAWVCVTEPSQHRGLELSCMAGTIPSPMLMPELCLGTMLIDTAQNHLWTLWRMYELRYQVPRTTALLTERYTALEKDKEGRWATGSLRL